MFKRLLLIFLAVVCTTAIAHADDRSRLGFKSHIGSVESDFEGYTFDADGELQRFEIQLWGFETDDVNKTSKGYKGECSYTFLDKNDESHLLSGTFEATVTGGHITEIRVKCENEDEDSENDIKINNASAVIKLTYANSVLTKALTTESWTEVQVNVPVYEGSWSGSIESDAEDRHARAQAVIDKAYEEALKRPFDIEGNKKKMLKAQEEAARILEGTEVNISASVSTSSRTRTHSQKYTETYTVNFKNYEYDEEGKWISRTIIENGDESEDNCRYTFTTKYICEQQWKQCLESGQLKNVEDFAKSDSVLTAAIRKDGYALYDLEQADYDIIKAYRYKAAEYWNAHILDEVAKRNTNDVDVLFAVAQNPIVYPQVKDAALELINKQIYDRALAETDFQKVEKFVNYKIDDTNILKDQYRDLIQSRATQLRNDSIAHLEHSVSEAYDAGKYADATKYCRNLLEIDRTHSLARQRLADAELELIKQTPTQTLEELREKCKTYQQNYAYANSQCVEAGDYYVGALLNEDFYNLRSYIQEIDEVARLFIMSATSRESLRTARHRSQKKLDRRAFRHSMFHGEGNFVGVKVGAGIGGGNSEFGWFADANLRFGRMCNWFNIVVGGRYVAAKGQDSDKVRGRLAYSQIVIPAELRWNIYHGDECAFYLGAGAEGHVPLKADYAWRIDGSHADGDAVYDYSDSKKEYLASTYWAPRLSLGITTRYFELEVFGSKASQGKYNTELLQKEKVDRLIGQNIFDTQTNGGLFIGAAIRLGF